MIDPQKYTNARQFRQALDAKIKAIALAEKVSIEDLRRQVVFNRFLARVDFSKFVLTGGYSLELRLPLSRSTTDIDLYVRDVKLIVGTSEEQGLGILAALREEATKVLHDYFSFEVERILSKLQGPKEGGARCLIMAKLNDKEYYKFHVDVAICPVEILEPEIINIHSMIGISDQVQIAVLQKEELFANKVHAYTRPRQTENTRVEDLVDMALLIKSGLSKNKTALSIEKVFTDSKDHQQIPSQLALPPVSWQREFELIADRRNLPVTLPEAFANVSEFYSGLFGSLDVGVGANWRDAK